MNMLHRTVSNIIVLKQKLEITWTECGLWRTDVKPVCSDHWLSFPLHLAFGREVSDEKRTVGMRNQRLLL